MCFSCMLQDVMLHTSADVGWLFDYTAQLISYKMKNREQEVGSGRQVHLEIQLRVGANTHTRKTEAFSIKFRRLFHCPTPIQDNISNRLKVWRFGALCQLCPFSCVIESTALLHNLNCWLQIRCASRSTCIHTVLFWACTIMSEVLNNGYCIILFLVQFSEGDFLSDQKTKEIHHNPHASGARFIFFMPSCFACFVKTYYKTNIKYSQRSESNY